MNRRCFLGCWLFTRWMFQEKRPINPDSGKLKYYSTTNYYGVFPFPFPSHAFLSERAVGQGAGARTDASQQSLLRLRLTGGNLANQRCSFRWS
jgi:hypothetical protein